jgi:hypothetical protein
MARRSPSRPFYPLRHLAAHSVTTSSTAEVSPVARLALRLPNKKPQPPGAAGWGLVYYGTKCENRMPDISAG